ncbi:Zn-ribbon domain-containing OB-fold protein [Ramlibacter algicola]|uniref:OB-fold domain-containing protein n=1 Tax=Ramlibacter algicola TaxID=2795217 RepID=A0A934URH9_9BURK|nr:OB-fold domain-containing protein [Ramlibacter algicola]MBK0392557.1 OB-fold domain-containing protein [Ramlibacter algicola]
MSYFPDDMPRPEPTMDEAGFWEFCKDRSLRFQACTSCGTLRHPPLPMCPHCQSCGIDWKEAPPDAEVYSYTVVRHASHPAVTPRLPYVVAVVEFPALPGVRLITNITDIDPGAVRIGLPVKLWWDDIGEGMHVPRFRA